MVDGLAETETVLRAVLEPQGAQVERRRSSSASFAGAPPEVLIVDLDDRSDDDQTDTSWPDVPRVFLSSAPLGPTADRERFLEKPFQYPELVRLVQRLLDPPTERRRAA